MNTEEQKIKFAMPSLNISEVQPIEQMGPSGEDDWGMGEFS